MVKIAKVVTKVKSDGTNLCNANKSDSQSGGPSTSQCDSSDASSSCRSEFALEE